MKFNKKLKPKDVWGACEFGLNTKDRTIEVINYINDLRPRWFIIFSFIQNGDVENVLVNFISNIPSDTEGFLQYIILKANIMCDHYHDLAEMAWNKGNHNIEQARRHRAEALLKLSSRLETGSYGFA